MNCFFIIAGVNTVAVVSAFLSFTLKIVIIHVPNLQAENLELQYWTLEKHLGTLMSIYLAVHPIHLSICRRLPWWWRTYSRMDIQRNRITEEPRQSICAIFRQHLPTDFGSEGTKYFLDKGTIISIIKVARWKKHFCICSHHTGHL